MLIRKLVSLTVCSWFFALPVVRAEPTNGELRHELLQRLEEDQEARQQVLKAFEQQKENAADEKTVLEAAKALRVVDERNTERLKEIIEEYGWPGKTLVGEQAASAAWMIVQHADHDRPFQKVCLGLLADAVRAKEAVGKNLAYLTDRVLIGENQKQLYGTQLREENGKLEPLPIEDEENVDKRRDVGLPSLADYLKFAQALQSGFKPPKE